MRSLCVKFYTELAIIGGDDYQLALTRLANSLQAAAPIEYLENQNLERVLELMKHAERIAAENKRASR